MIFRALVRRCPRCADRRAWFHSFFKQGERCVGCGLRRTRGVDGHELGSMTVAITVNIGLIMLCMGVAVAITIPDVPVVTLYVILTVSAIVIPVATWPITHTLWSAIDLRVRPLSADEASDALSWVNTHRDTTP
ncbi:MAG: hypothetical protein ACO3GZ_06050 [Ilumatobacteraceae bacterium]